MSRILFSVDKSLETSSILHFLGAQDASKLNIQLTAITLTDCYCSVISLQHNLYVNRAASVFYRITFYIVNIHNYFFPSKVIHALLQIEKI